VADSAPPREHQGEEGACDTCGYIHGEDLYCFESADLHADAFAALSVRAFENDSWAEIAPEVFNDYDSRMAVSHKTIHQAVVTLQASGGISAASDPRRTDLTEELVERMLIHFPNQQDVTSHTSPSDEARLVEATGFFERRRSGELTERRLLGITKDAQVVVHLVLLWLPQTFPPSCTVSCMEWYVLRRYCRGLCCMSYALTDCVASLGEMGDNWSDWVRRADWWLLSATSERDLGFAKSCRRWVVRCVSLMHVFSCIRGEPNPVVGDLVHR